MKYNIWVEGYCCTGEFGTARLITSNVEGKSFINAVENWWNSLSKKDKEGWGGKIYINEEKNYASIWACRLFDNESEARKAFG